MRPYVIVHMVSSLDGRIITKHWPDDQRAKLGVYEQVHDTFNVDAWLVGRVTMAHYEKGEPNPVKAESAYPRSNWRAPNADSGSYAIAVDRSGKLHVNRTDISGDAIIMILSESVTDDHLAELQRDGISYIFAGEREIDLAAALQTLRTEFGIERLAVEGGGNVNGSFFSAGLVDEVSLLVMPMIDGGAGLPSIVDRPVPGYSGLSLKSVDRIESDLIHLRYLTA